MDATESGFYVGSRDQTWVSVLVWQLIEWLNHLPNRECRFIVEGT